MAWTSSSPGPSQPLKNIIDTAISRNRFNRADLENCLPTANLTAISYEVLYEAVLYANARAKALDQEISLLLERVQEVGGGSGPVQRWYDVDLSGFQQASQNMLHEDLVARCRVLLVSLITERCRKEAELRELMRQLAAALDGLTGES